MAQSIAGVACIAAFSREISRFLDEEEHQRLCQASRLLWSVFALRACCPDPSNRAQGVASLIQNQDALARELRAVLQNARKSTSSTAKSRAKRSKNGFARLRDDQLRSLVLDLVLVGLGVRASCLVDTCQLDEEAVLAMTSTFSTQKSWHPYGLHHLSAVLVAGNVFFVHTSEFVRLKCLDLAMELQNAILIDACGELRMPRQISNATNDPGGTRRRLVDTTQQLVNSVADSSVARRRSPIQLHTNGVCATAVAGIILCYPVIYHVSTTRSTEDNDPFWMTSDNCLGMRPLFLFQASLWYVRSNPKHQTGILKLC
jgi:hypothetical protein